MLETKQTKICNICKLPKDISEFGRYTTTRKATGKTYEYVWRRCNSCRNKKHREYQSNWLAPDEMKEYKANWASTPKGQASHRRRLLKLYGLSAADYERMLKEQDGRCAICQKKPNYILCVDHNHTTGVARALICRRCNIGIGYLEQYDWIANANEYLRKFMS